MPRSYDRAPDQLRPVEIEPGFVRTATGSALISCGETRVICTASVQESVPKWMQGRGRGWVTAEYGMRPASPGDRKQRDVSKGRPDGRTVEIQRLIGRSLRGVVDFAALGERTVYVDCDVLQADGGTRCAAISGAYVAAARALGKAGLSRALTDSVAAVVNPRTDRPCRMIAPAPRKPIPVTICAAIRVGSARMTLSPEVRNSRKP